jgi:hypothetical protein
VSKEDTLAKVGQRGVAGLDDEVVLGLAPPLLLLEVGELGISQILIEIAPGADGPSWTALGVVQVDVTRGEKWS